MAKTAKTRTERDSLGEINVPADRYWGAVTQRTLENFPIGGETMPRPVVAAMAVVKHAAASANETLGTLDKKRAAAIRDAAQQVIDGKLDDHFPLPVWQTGSGTQTNMNVNEVIANVASAALGGTMGKRDPVHPNDHVNKSQSTNDSFPTAMHIAAASEIARRLRPVLDLLFREFNRKAAEWAEIIKIGRTHLQDAVPLTFGQEFSGYARQIGTLIDRLDTAMDDLAELPMGGTAVGTGLNAPTGFDREIVAEIATLTGLRFEPAENKFAGIASHDALVGLSGVLNTLASALMKIGNDLRLMSSGPRAGLGELSLPANEPGSSIMPGKVNPTQIEALTQVCAHVMGNHAAVTIANSHGHLELNVFKPVIIYNVLQSIGLLSDAVESFVERCLVGTTVNRARIDEYLERSLMLVTALAPEIGYDNAAKAAHHAFEKDLSLREAVLELDLLSEDAFQRLADPKTMIGPGKGNG